MTIADLARYRTVAIDGCDGTGKTTLALALATRYGFHRIHSTRTPDGIDLLTRYQRILDIPGHLVLDRCFVSELVYGPLHHHSSRLTLSDARALACDVTFRDGVLVHLTGHPSTIHQRLRARDGRNVTNLSQVTHLIATYARIFDQLADTVPVLRVDSTPGHPSDPAQP